MLDEFDVDNLRQVVLHELCHYHLHLNGQDYHHRSHAFKVLLQQVGGKRYAPTTSARRISSANRLIYQCTKCQAIISRKQHFNTVRYVCARCGGHFKLISTS